MNNALLQLKSMDNSRFSKYKVQRMKKGKRRILRKNLNYPFFCECTC